MNESVIGHKNGVEAFKVCRPHTATGFGTGSCTSGVYGDFRVTSVTGVPDMR